MPRFLLRIAAFLALQGVVFALLYRPDMPGQGNYLAATIEKHRRLATTRPPRLILLGGSNVAFGFDSGRLERETGLTVVNMGLAAGLGGDFMLNEAAGAVGQGDMVVLFLEYDQYVVAGNVTALRQLLEFRPASALHLPARRWRRFLDEEALGILGAAVRRSQPWLGPEAARSPSEAWYSRTGFTAAGDYRGHHGVPATMAALPAGDPVFTPPRAGPLNPRFGRELASFADLAGRRGARFFVSWPAIVDEAFAPAEPAVERLRAELAALPGVTLLGEPRDHVFGRSLGFDLTYHVNAAGAEWRTERLLRRLREAGVGKATRG
ncbi:MAG: hypothetical protein ACKVYV_07110 [Limisphaerales bacterium]